MERVSERHMGRRVDIVCVNVEAWVVSRPIRGRILNMRNEQFLFLNTERNEISWIRNRMWRILKVY